MGRGGRAHAGPSAGGSLPWQLATAAVGFLGLAALVWGMTERTSRLRGEGLLEERVGEHQATVASAQQLEAQLLMRERELTAARVDLELARRTTVPRRVPVAIDEEGWMRTGEALELLDGLVELRLSLPGPAAPASLELGLSLVAPAPPDPTTSLRFWLRPEDLTAAPFRLEGGAKPERAELLVFPLPAETAQRVRALIDAAGLAPKSP